MNRKKIILFFVVFLLGVGITIYFYSSNSKQVEVERQTFLLNKVKRISELNVVEMDYASKISDEKGNNTFNILGKEIGIPGTWNKIILLFNAKVKAAVELSSLNKKTLTVTGDTVKLKLKKPYISGVDISNIEVYEDNGLFEGDKKYREVVDIYNKKMKASAVKSAMKDNIIKKAESNARKSLKNIVLSFNKDVKKVQVEFIK